MGTASVPDPSLTIRKRGAIAPLEFARRYNHELEEFTRASPTISTIRVDRAVFKKLKKTELKKNSRRSE